MLAELWVNAAARADENRVGDDGIERRDAELESSVVDNFELAINLVASISSRLSQQLMDGCLSSFHGHPLVEEGFHLPFVVGSIGEVPCPIDSSINDPVIVLLDSVLSAKLIPFPLREVDNKGNLNKHCSPSSVKI